MKSRNIVVIFLISLIMFLGAGTLAVKAFSEEISMYSGLPRVTSDKVTEELMKMTGINIHCLSLSGGVLWSRIQSEKPNIQADLVDGMGAFDAIEAKRQGLFVPYKSKAWDRIPERFKDPDGYYYHPNLWAAMLASNPKLLEEKRLDPPKSWHDLVDPKWKGQISIPSPLTSGSGQIILLGLVYMMGEDAAFDYLEKLDKNIKEYTKSGGAPAFQTARGEVVLGLSDTTNIYHYILENYPIKGVFLKEGYPYTLTALAIFKSTKNLELAKKVVDAMATREVMAIKGKYQVVVAHPEVSGTEKEFFGKIPLMKDLNQTWMADNLRRLQTKWKERFMK